MKFLLISPREPSGATWLINCLLELGIKTYRRKDSCWMWFKQENGSYILNPEENILRKWLPILSREKEFYFRDDIEVQWTHEWPITEYSAFPVIYFIRDPRDSIHSRYKREAPSVSFADFIDIPDAETLLNKIDNWILFNLYWLRRNNLKVFRFEDYKNDASGTLKSILEYIQVVPDSNKFQKAIAESTSAKAREAENEYRKNNNSDSQVINRASAVSEWKKMSNPGNKKVIDEIEAKSKPLLKRFGYEVNEITSASKELSVYPNVNVIAIFNQLEFKPEEVLQNDNKYGSSVYYLSGFVKTLNNKWRNECKMLPFEVDVLLNNLLLFFQVINEKRLYSKVLIMKTRFKQDDRRNLLSLNLKHLMPSAFYKIIKKNRT